MNFKKKEIGASSVEAIVGLFALLPVVYLTSEMVKIGDINNSLIQGSRYVAWERTIASNEVKTDQQLKNEVNQRLLSNQNEMLTSNIDEDTETPRNGFWNTFVVKEEAQQPQSQKSINASDANMNNTQKKIHYSALNSYETDINVDESGMSGVSSVFTNLQRGISKIVEPLSDGDGLNLNDHGLYKANLEQSIKTTRYQSIPSGDGEKSNDNKSCKEEKALLCIQRQNVILADTWQSYSPKEVGEKVKSLVPSKPLKPYEEIANLVGVTQILEDFEEFDGVLGHVEPDEIPADRLGE